MPTVRLPNEVFDETHPLWKDFLVGRFLAKTPFVGGIHALVNKIWTLGDKTIKIDVFVVDNTTVRFRIRDERMRSRVLKRGMWNLCGVPVVLSKWSPIAELEPEEIKTVSIWVIVKNVPPKYFSWEVLSAITSPLGTPKQLHSDTESCKSFTEAKVLVEVNLTKRLPNKMSFKSEKGGDTIVEFVYPWLPARCTLCSKWGHLEDTCTTKKDQGISCPSQPTLEQSEKNSGEKVVSGSGGVTNLGIVESSELKQGVTEVVVDQVAENTADTEGEKDLGWTTPTKGLRSPVKQVASSKDISNMSNSFSCLSDKGEQGEALDTTVGESSGPTTANSDVVNLPTDTTTSGAEMLLEKQNQEGGNAPERQETGLSLRPSLPRASKGVHKFVSTTSSQSFRAQAPSSLKPRQTPTQL
ncbi:PREDICTED: uncharacterized protein LOC104699473 [Camelina sativa]|uniref:Uncharacterized protein LOC104699473 n=1 Tax=Camelina sativa TaxID=90675 RepID=A0ABM0SLN8_CAMSA|nr:PREDICTED: uncharacterized protein LOC104699473 [Camelina sativa]